MSVPQETIALPPPNATQLPSAAMPDRRMDVDGKQARVAELLRETACEGLLLLDPANIAWLTSGFAPRPDLGSSEQPALYCSGEQRWLLCCNVDTQRLFDEEIDGLGFQLKEWPWHVGRTTLLTDLIHGRSVASDQPQEGAKPIGDRLATLRRQLTPYEEACCKLLGQTLSHALEATCRNVNRNDSERQVAGQLSHRLFHRGVQPITIEVAADGRSRRYRRPGFTSATVRNYCVITCTARKYGLYATSSRSLSFGTLDAGFRQEFEAACRIGATYAASTWPDALPREILNTGRRVAKLSGHEHEWALCPPGHVTGRQPVELPISPQTEELFHSGWAVTWRASVGAAVCCDTFLVTEKGPKLVTPSENWPQKRIRIQGTQMTCPDLLER